MSPSVGENSWRDLWADISLLTRALSTVCSFAPLLEGLVPGAALAILPATALLFLCLDFSLSTVALYETRYWNAGSADALVRTARKARSVCRPLKRARKSSGA